MPSLHYGIIAVLSKKPDGIQVLQTMVLTVRTEVMRLYLLTLIKEGVSLISLDICSCMVFQKVEDIQ